LGDLTVVRWPVGGKDFALLPPHEDCRIGDRDIVASFHTHPNSGGDYLQEPGETEKRAVRDDPDLKGSVYVGEFVVSESRTYLITPMGDVLNLGDTRTLLFAEQGG
jgi:hypothetical protein